MRLISSFHTTSSGSRALDVSEATLRRMAERGQIRVIRTATGVRLYPTTEIERVLAERAAARDARPAPTAPEAA